MTNEEILMKNRDGCSLPLLKHSDEEKAEEKYQEHINKESCYVSKPEEEIYTDGFLDGLAEGRKDGYEQGYEDCRHYAHDYYKPKWHDLRKDPNDLPKSRGYYLVAMENCIESTMSYFNYSEMEFNGEVIAWTELPKFEEK